MPDVEHSERSERGQSAMGLKEWLTVAQLLLTAFTGIFLALYFRARDEDLRRDLISLQAETERQAHLAHIDLQPICPTSRSCDGTVEIRNIGPAVATNIRTVLVVESLDPAWKAQVDDVGRFTVRRFPPSVTVAITETQADVLSETRPITDNNAVEITAATLPPGANFQVLLTLGSSIPVDTYRVSRPATLYAEALFSDRPIGQFLERLFPVAEFSASTSCDNCEGFKSGVRFMVSALDTWDYRTVNLNLQRNSLDWRILLDAGYRVPAGTPHTPVTTPLYLRANAAERGSEPTLVEVPAPQ